MKPRAAWPVLAKKAKEKCDEAQALVRAARDRVKQFEQSRARMVMLHQDYMVRSREAEKKAQSMAETMNFRSFMQQLQSLIDRVDVDLAHAKEEVKLAQIKLQAAEQKRIQMETLVEQDLKAVRDYERKKEQREMDAAGVMLYNLKH